MPFCREIRGKSKLSANYPAESFSIPRKVKISFFKGLSLLPQIILDENSTVGDLSLLPQIILDENSTMGDQYYPRFERKN
jgi:hypothetical protein